MPDRRDDPDTRRQALAEIFDRSADTYDHVGVDYFTPAGVDLVAAAGLRPGQRVLDLGTGRGAVLFAAAAAVGPTGRAVGIDISPRMVELTQAEAAARGLEQVTVAVADAGAPDFPAQSFDAVLAGLSILFVPDPDRALRRYAQLLTKRGRIAFSTYGTPDPTFEAAMGELDRHITGPRERRDERQGAFGSRDGITELLTRTGFTDVVIDERSYESRFADPEHWLAWVWSHGGRLTLERIPAERLDDAVAAATAAFAAARTPAGDYLIRSEIRFTVAVAA